MSLREGALMVKGEAVPVLQAPYHHLHGEGTRLGDSVVNEHRWVAVGIVLIFEDRKLWLQI